MAIHLMTLPKGQTAPFGKEVVADCLIKGVFGEAVLCAMGEDKDGLKQILGLRGLCNQCDSIQHIRRFAPPKLVAFELMPLRRGRK